MGVPVHGRVRRRRNVCWFGAVHRKKEVTIWETYTGILGDNILFKRWIERRVYIRETYKGILGYNYLFKRVWAWAEKLSLPSQPWSGIGHQRNILASTFHRVSPCFLLIRNFLITRGWWNPPPPLTSYLFKIERRVYIRETYKGILGYNYLFKMSVDEIPQDTGSQWVEWFMKCYWIWKRSVHTSKRFHNKWVIR